MTVQNNFNVKHYKHFQTGKVYATVLCMCDFSTGIEYIVIKDVQTGHHFSLPRHELNMRIRTNEGLVYAMQEVPEPTPIKPVRDYPGYKNDPRQTGYRSTPWAGPLDR